MKRRDLVRELETYWMNEVIAEGGLFFICRLDWPPVFIVDQRQMKRKNI